MLRLAATEVRTRLAATYGLSATLVESRLATWFRLWGQVDASRAAEALTLVRARLQDLAAGGPDLAPMFVIARRRVLERLAAVDTVAGELAERAAHNVELGRAHDADVGLIEAVRQVTLSQLGDTLAGLDPPRGVVSLRGPDAVLGTAFRALGVEP
jgi:hypothetical protein